MSPTSSRLKNDQTPRDLATAVAGGVSSVLLIFFGTGGFQIYGYILGGLSLFSFAYAWFKIRRVFGVLLTDEAIEVEYRAKAFRILYDEAQLSGWALLDKSRGRRHYLHADLANLDQVLAELKERIGAQSN